MTTHEPSASFVKEVAVLADRAKEIKSTAVSIVDPYTGQSVSIPLALIGQTQIDLAAELDRWRTAPPIREGVAYVDTIESFIDLTKRHQDKDSTIFAQFGDHAEPSLETVVDYHTIEHKPRGAHHRIKYNFPLSREWKAWRGVSGVKLAQNQFAEWIEAHIHEIVEADEAERGEYEAFLALKFGSPHELVRVARGVSIHADLKVESIQTLQSGEMQIGYAEAHTVKGSDQKPIRVPGLIMVRIPMFVGGDEVRIPMRLRYERDGPVVKWMFLSFRADQILLATLERDYKFALESTGLPGFRGAPEA